jgi:N-acetylglutamate synthase-like GNAT family acetyltransferase
MLSSVHVVREERELEDYTKIEYKVYDEYEISIIGYAAVLVEEEHACINVINVDRGHRGHGIGTAILLSILEDLRDKKIEVKTFSYLVPWYKKHGFKLLDESGNIFHLVYQPSLQC